MSTNKTVKFGLLGAGGIAQAYSEAIKEVDNAQVVAIADANLEAAEKMAAEHGAQAFDSWEALKAANAIDALIVCTPPSYHPEHCIEFLSNGIHVLCENPLAISSASAVEMAKAAKAGNVVFTMASKFRFVDDVAVAKEMVDSGKLGEIILYENCFTGVVDMSTRWNSNPELSGGGVLIDNGTHSLDIMRHFLGDLAEIRVVEGKRIQKLDVEDTVHVFVRSSGGTLGSIDLSWSLHKDLAYFISLYGSEGTVEIGWRGSRVKMKGEKAWTEFGTGYNKIESFRNQLGNFAGAILNDEPLVITPEDGIASVCSVEAAYQAMQASEWQSVDYFDKLKV